MSTSPERTGWRANTKPYDGPHEQLTREEAEERFPLDEILRDAVCVRYGTRRRHIGLERQAMSGEESQEVNPEF